MTLVRYIAEAGQTMRGDVGLAVEMVHAFAEAGATHFKVQMLDPMTIATPDARSYWNTGPDVNQRKSFHDNGVIPHTGWDRVRQACYDAKIGFVATPFDLDAVRALLDLQPDAVKIASGDITYLPLLDAIAERFPRTHILLSTGASTWNEVSDAIQRLVLDGARGVVPLACTLAYPTDIMDANLGRIRTLSNLASTRGVGYSDHTTETETAMMAVAAGARWLEKHVSPYPVHPASMSDLHGTAVPDDMMALSAARFAEYVSFGECGIAMTGGGDTIAECELPARTGARRAARFARDLPADHLIDGSEFTYLRPDPEGDGASIRRAASAVKTLRAVVAGEIVTTDAVRVLAR